MVAVFRLLIMWLARQRGLLPELPAGSLAEQFAVIDRQLSYRGLFSAEWADEYLRVVKAGSETEGDSPVDDDGRGLSYRSANLRNGTALVRGHSGTCAGGPYRYLHRMGAEALGCDLLNPEVAGVRAVAQTCEGVQSPHAFISGVYEDLLGYELGSSSDGGPPGLVRNASLRKMHGAFYTPVSVARSVVELSLDPLVISGGMPSLLDPAMGTGVFLLAAVHGLAKRQVGDAALAEIAESTLHGVDRDALAVELANLGLWLEIGARPAILAHRLRSGDVLVAAGQDSASFDVVVGNPPWGSRLDRHKRRLLASLFPHLAESSIDSFKLFLEFGARLTHGTLGMIVPQAMLRQSLHTDVRRGLLDRLDPYAVLHLGPGHFAGAAAPACGLVFGPKPGPATIRYITAHTPGSPRAPRSILASSWSAHGFPLENTQALDLLHRLQRSHPALGHLRHLYRVRDVGINYNRAPIAMRSLYSADEPAHPDDLPRYRGRDFGRYTPIHQGGWMRADIEYTLQPGERFSLGWSTCRLPEKIVLRQTADGLIATLDRTRMLMGRSVLAITAEADVSLPALLALLNSRLLTFLYRTLSGEEGRIMAQVKVATLHALPIPEVCSTRVTTVAGCDHDLGRAERDPEFAWNRLHHLALRMLAAGGADEMADRLIDSAVCALYGLQINEFEEIATNF